MQPFEVSYTTTGRKGKKARNVIGVLCPTVLAQRLGLAQPIFVSLGDVSVDWNAPQSEGYRAMFDAPNARVQPLPWAVGSTELLGVLVDKREERRMLNTLKDPAKRAEWVYGQPMAPCPKCGSYNMKPQMPIAMETTGDETAPQLVGKWARATKAGATPLQGPAYYACWDCFHKGPAVDCTGRTSEACRADRALNAEMKRLWNAQTPNVELSGLQRPRRKDEDGTDIACR